MDSRKVLGPDGLVAKKLSGFESRPQQLDMADAVAEAIVEKRKLLVEAGTGVGKSFAYLVPAIQAAAAKKDFRVVISTHTISLQEQLIRKDLPFLQSVVAGDWRPVLVKGRGNYLSLRRLRAAQQRANTLLDTNGAIDQLIQIGRWSRRSRTSRCGTSCRATAPTASAANARRTPSASTSRRASESSGRMCSW
jgi:ATP-dependent DNA helicase DinG